MIFILYNLFIEFGSIVSDLDSWSIVNFLIKYIQNYSYIIKILSYKYVSWIYSHVYEYNRNFVIESYSYTSMYTEYNHINISTIEILKTISIIEIKLYLINKTMSI